jgi:hypothetical protein
MGVTSWAWEGEAVKVALAWSFAPPARVLDAAGHGSTLVFGRWMWIDREPGSRRRTVLGAIPNGAGGIGGIRRGVTSIPQRIVRATPGQRFVRRLDIPRNRPLLSMVRTLHFFGGAEG